MITILNGGTLSPALLTFSERIKLALAILRGRPHPVKDLILEVK